MNIEHTLAESQKDSPYNNLADIINDDLFAELDSRLRRGEHIDNRHTHFYAMLQNGEHWLMQHYRRYGVDLVRAQEDFYYLRPNLGSKNLIRSRKIDELGMLLGQLLALYHLDPEQLEGSGWITADAIYERLRLLIDEERLAKLLDRKKLDTQLDRDKGMEVLKRSLRQLARLGMIRLEGIRADQIQTQSPLMRFIEPVRSAALTREALEQLVATGSVCLEADDEIADDDQPATASTKQQQQTTEPEAQQEVTEGGSK
ncbi:chromosome partition protein MukE [Endozoicomonas montiporae]|uniref:Chromosome partition protein n=1 Tax=Endozoicomonas montiporae CL-33 TaxID=570277 RepID=A0A142BDH5_9GAMM|nr:chromosome partition protein MukE [Endozoicomonas montiporae]AMO56801.1 chromosome partition protein [Endozoicomonas montiporae CL-33]